MHSVQIDSHNRGTLFYPIVASLLIPNVSRDRSCSNFALSRRPHVSVNIAFSVTIFNEDTGNVVFGMQTRKLRELAGSC